VSEQQAEPTHGEGGSVGTEPAVQTSVDASAPVTASAPESGSSEAPAIAPDHETLPKHDTPKETPKIGTAGTDAVKMGAGQADASKTQADVSRMQVDASKMQADASKMNESFLNGRLLIKSPGKRGWHRAGESAKVDAEPVSAGSGTHRFAGIAALVALAVLAGAVSGAMATVAVMHLAAADAAASASGGEAVEASVSRIDADILALKAGLEHATTTSQSQFNKANDRLDKIEKAQAEPSAKLAKLSEAMDRLRIPPAAPAAAATTAATPAATRDITGSVTPSSANAAATSSASSAPPAPVAPPKTEIARLPKVDGWVLRDVNHGGALIEGRQGLYEVYAGDPVPGLGKVDAIRKQDGRWVVVTTKGLVVAR
jgi:hypothetical protein